MLLLSFTVRNHGSIRDQVTLDLLKPGMRTLRPADDDWVANTYTVAGVFGPNASGKSRLLDAVVYFNEAIRRSSSTWLDRREMPRAPFALDGVSASEPGLFEADFVHEGRRYLYGFEVDQDGVRREWLKDVPNSRWRTLFDRDATRGTLSKHSSVASVGTVARRELVLSRALKTGHPQLSAVAQDLVESFDFVGVSGGDREGRLSVITEALAQGELTKQDIVGLVEVADIGITDVSIREETMPPGLRRLLAVFLGDRSEVQEVDAQESRAVGDDADDPITERDSDAVIRSLQFTHRAGGDAAPFNIEMESNGTVAWLALAVPALERLRNGGLYLVDEIDASLHPHLVDLLIGMFADAEVNVHGAQLVFTSHDTYVISGLSETELDPGQIWFTDKSYEGVTTLFSLADFPRQKERNAARRYLLGRYGAVPRLLPSTLAALVTRGE